MVDAPAQPAPEAGSYRDRNGAVFYHDGGVYRAVSAKALADWERLFATPFFRRFVEAGRIVETERVDAPSGAPSGYAATLRHARVPFVSYPYEWPFHMLKAAALLHLDLMQAALDADMILKDSSAYNIQFRGVEPVFIDIPSFEALAQGEPWVGYRQFCEMFLYPLMLQAYKGVDYRPFMRGSLDGIPASVLRPLLSTRDLARSGVLLHVVAQNALQQRYSPKDTGVKGSLAKAGFDKRLIVNNVAGLRRLVEKLEPRGAKTTWADYATTHSYDTAEFEAKRAFVAQAAASRRWRLAWDLGCNTGTFSRILAEHSDSVVAMDGDRMAVDHLFATQAGRPDARQILPLVVNLADPSPNQGWLGMERRSLPDRGRPELTLVLALIHHIVISANIPVREFIGWLAGLGTAVVIEFVGRGDEMVQRLLLNRDDQYPDYDDAPFEAALAERFAIQSSQPLKGGKRRIYFALPKP